MSKSPYPASRLAGALLLAATIASGANAQLEVGPPVIPSTGATHVEGEILVKFRDAVPSDVQTAVHASLGATVLYESARAHFQRVSVPPGLGERELIAAYQSLPMVEYAELNTICRATGVPNDPFYVYQWHMPQIDMETAWDTATGTGAVVAILDSGVAYENFAVPSWESTTVAPGVTSYQIAPDLVNTTFVPGYDFINNDSHPNDNNAHGTHVAGTVAQSTNNSTGVAGVAYNAAIMPVKVLNYQGSGTAAALADGLHFCADNGADVANMSLSWPSGFNPGSTVSNAVNYAYNAGVTLVAAAGNEGVGTVSYPAAYGNVIAVGAVRYDQTRSYYSQYGSALEIMAPGGDVTIDQNGDGYADGVLQNTFVAYQSPGSKANPNSFGYYFYQGTSMASPHVAGVVALMVSNGITGPANIRSILQSTANDLGSPGWDSGYGWGLVDAAAAIGGGGPPDTTPPNPDPMTWASIPASGGTTSITMTATTATDASGVEYYFENIVGGGNDSGWQDSPSYTDTGLSPNTFYSYRVQARDKSVNQNATGWAPTLGATTDAGSGWIELTYDDFESGFGNFVDGGSDCSRYTGGTHSFQGAASIDLQDNSGNASTTTLGGSLNLATPGYTQLQIEFAFKAVSMETNEDFWVQYFDGTSWITVADLDSGVDFSNNTFYTVTLTLTEGSVTFPSNASVRFRCDASNNADDVYIDTVRISAQ